jgi:soluble lytic murein transglycosylase-like protein
MTLRRWLLPALVACALVAPAAWAQDAPAFGAARPPAVRDAARFDETFKKYSKRYFGIGFDWRHFKAQAMAESELNPDARSWVGARGLMQLMPSTFNAIASKRPEFTSIDDPEWNIAAGILHDSWLWKLWTTDVAEAERPAFMFGSYNAGEGTITRATERARAEQLDHASWESIARVAPTIPKWRYQETLGYVRKIESNYARLTAKPR